MKPGITSTALSVFILLFSACDFNDNKLVIENKSSQPVYYLAYPDTIVQLSSVENFAAIPYRRINTNDSTHALFARRGEGGLINKINSVCKDSTLKIFFFPVDSVNKYGWRKILRLRKYNRYDYTASMLDSLKWRIIYNN